MGESGEGERDIQYEVRKWSVLDYFRVWQASDGLCYRGQGSAELVLGYVQVLIGRFLYVNGKVRRYDLSFGF